MNVKQKRFCEEYIIDFNGTKAAIRAGYSAKTARTIANQLLTKLDIKQWIETKLAEIEDEKIADAKEVMKYLTSVMRSESESEIVVVEGTGEGCSEARRMLKAPDEKERLKAAELLGKRFGIFKDNVNVNAIPVVISGEDELE